MNLTGSNGKHTTTIVEYGFAIISRLLVLHISFWVYGTVNIDQQPLLF